MTKRQDELWSAVEALASELGMAQLKAHRAEEELIDAKGLVKTLTYRVKEAMREYKTI